MGLKAFILPALLLFVSCVGPAYPATPKDRIDSYKQIDTPLSTPRLQTWREHLIGWAYRVSEHFDLDPIVVSGASEIFDRFLIKRPNTKIDDYRLYFTSSYILSVKLHEKDVSMKTFASLSRDTFSVEDLRQSERFVCEVLRWKLWYVTPAHYVREYFEHIKNMGFTSVGQAELIGAIEWTACNEAYIAPYKSKRGMSSCDIATNCIIDAVNKINPPAQEKEYLFLVLGFLLGENS